MTDEGLIGEVLNGKTRIWRFTAEEQGGSSDTADRLLWLGILRAEHELATALFGGVLEGQGSQARGTPSPSRFLKELAQPIPSSFDSLVKDIGRYEDRGQESIVCDGGDGFVNKLRPMKPFFLCGTSLQDRGRRRLPAPCWSQMLCDWVGSRLWYVRSCCRAGLFIRIST